MDKSLVEYVEGRIIPMYDGFDAGHGREHVNAVAQEALRLATFYDVNEEMVYAAAAYHDTGLCVDRKTHHLESGRIIREDRELDRWFTPDQIEVIAQAAEDHRASSDHEPRTIYGKIIAEADRQIIPESIILRTVQYGFKHYPEFDKEGHWARTCEHMAEKYDEGGYLKLWIPESRNALGLAELRAIIHEKSRLRAMFEAAYSECVDHQGLK
ncbi:MAG: HD domain-containing protein [Bacteroidaceae bacterium]|nr:HD domain-containing protein [Bacteroidaceae bacterium]